MAIAATAIAGTNVRHARTVQKKTARPGSFAATEESPTQNACSLGTANRVMSDRVRIDGHRLALLYKAHRSAIYARCRLILRRSDDAEDATQEVFLKLARNADQVPSANEALFWITRVATNHCLSELRRRRRESSFEDAETAAPARVEVCVVHRDLARRILRRLPDEVAVSAWLRYVEGMSHDEVGASLGLSRRTIFNHLDRFHRRARRFAEPESPD